MADTQILKSAALWRTRPGMIVGLWILASALLGVFGYLAEIKSTIPGPASTQSLLENPGEKSAIDAGIPRHDVLLLVLGSTKFDVNSIEFSNARDSLVHSLENHLSPSDSRKVFDKIETANHSNLDHSNFHSQDSKHLLIRATSVARIDQTEVEFKELPKLIKQWHEDFPSFSISYLSEGTANNEMFNLIDDDLDQSLKYTVPLTLAVLIFVFRSVVAALVPLLVALVSLIASLGATALLSHRIGPLSATASQLVVLLVLAIGVDYSLFMISRVREEAGRGRPTPEAIAHVRGTTGLAVFWSGITVALSLVGLFLINDTLLTSMAAVSILSVLLTMLGTLVALPSLLLLLGERILRQRISPIAHKVDRGRWVLASVAHPLIALSVGSAFMIGLAYSAFFINLGTTVEPALLPNALQSRSAFDALAKHFPDLGGTDFSLIARSKQLPVTQRGAVIDLLNTVAKFDNVRGPLGVDISSDQHVARYQFIAKGSGNTDINRKLIKHISDLIKSDQFAEQNIEISLAGTLPYVADEVVRYSINAPRALGAVLLLSFVFLLIAFRSLAVPIKAILLNLLSTAASFGVLKLVFQDLPYSGFNIGVVESFVPPLLFTILFGLSMDYHVFLLSRIREEVQRGANTAHAVQFGIARTATTITGAAAIMVCVFAVIASLQLAIMKQLGIGLAVAVFLDATVVRSILLPAGMILLGDWNWYLPSWLAWLPEIRHGEELPEANTPGMLGIAAFPERSK